MFRSGAAERHRCNRRTAAESSPSGRSAQGGAVLRYDASRVCEQEGDQSSEDEATDVGEKRRAAAVRVGTEQPEVRLDQLVEEPEAEEEPGRDPDGEDDSEPEDGGARVEHEVRGDDRHVDEWEAPGR